MVKNEAKSLSWEQMAWIKDQSLKYYNDHIPISLFVCGKVLLFAQVINNLDDLKEWKDEDVYKEANNVIEQNTLNDTQKKS